MRTGQVARQSGVNIQTLRYYERRGLLQAPPRRPSGYREYTSQAVEVVRFVKRAQELGFNLDEVESLLDLAAGGPASCDKARGLATRSSRSWIGRSPASGHCRAPCGGWSPRARDRAPNETARSWNP